MKMMQKKFLAAAAVLGMMGPAAKAATTIPGGGTAIAADSFNNLAVTVLGYAQGPLGIALAIVALLIGVGAGLMKSTAMPALVGVGVAVMLTFGPQVIVEMLTDTTTSSALI